MTVKILSMINSLINESDIIYGVFVAENYNFDSISVHPSYLGIARDKIVNTKLGALIDFPCGNSNVGLKLHACVEAVRQGATVLDIALSTMDLWNNRFEKMHGDLKILSDMADSKRVLLRAVLEYRVLEDAQLDKLAITLNKTNISTLILGTGAMAENFTDNLIIAHELQTNFNLNCYINGCLTKKQIETADENRVHGIQFTSANLVHKIFGV